MDITTLRQRIFAPKKSDAANEWEQCVLRVIIVLMLLGYFIYLDITQIFTDQLFSATKILSTYLFISFLTLISTYLYDSESHWRRYIGIIGDNFVISSMLFLGEEAGLPSLFIYLWIILGNGFRFGNKFLFICALFAVIGFTTVVLNVEYWKNNYYLLFTAYALIIIIPLYASKLIIQLHAAIDAANKANKAKSEFLSNMSHELRTPLNGVIGASDVLLGSKLDVQQRDMTRTIHFSANALLDQIQDILDFSKIEEKQYAVLHEEFKLSEILISIYSMFKYSAEEKGLQLKLDISPSIIDQFVGDEVIIRKILINLIGNAIKFTQQGFISISVDMCEIDESECKLKFSIVDTGIGIPEKSKDKIFKRFVQADESATRSFGGSGLGTAIAYHLVELIKGNIGVESEENKGSTFWFEIPVQTVDCETSEPPFNSTRSFKAACFVSSSYEPELANCLSGWGIQATFFDIDNHEKLKTYFDMGYEFTSFIIDPLLSENTVERITNNISKYTDILDSVFIIYSSDESVKLVPQNSQLNYIFCSPFDKRLLFNSLFEATVDKVKDSNVSYIEDYKKNKNNRSISICVVEDNIINQKVIKQILTSVGHQVYICNDGEEALEHLESTQYDLLIFDMNMPRMSGVDLLKTYRFIEEVKTPAIILSADATLETRKYCLEAGADAFVSKPFHADALLAEIKGLLVQYDQVLDKENIQDTSMELVKSQTLFDLKSVGGIGFLSELFSDFKESSNHLLKDINRAVDEKDYLLYQNSLHTLKGTAGDVGCNSLMDKCTKLEKIKVYEFNSSDMLYKLESLAKLVDNSLSEYEMQIEKIR